MMAHDTPPPAAANHPATAAHWLGVACGGHRFLVPLAQSGEIAAPSAVQPLPHAKAWVRGVTTLRGEQISDAGVARAVLLLQALDREIRLHTHNQRSLDDVTQALMRLNSVSTQEFVQLSESVLGGSSKVLQTKLLD